MTTKSDTIAYYLTESFNTPEAVSAQLSQTRDDFEEASIPPVKYINSLRRRRGVVSEMPFTSRLIWACSALKYLV